MTKSLVLVDEAQLNENAQLSNTGHTIKFVLQKLHEHNPVFVKLLGDDKVVKITAHDISDGKGYCSRVYKTSVWIGDVEQKPYTFILKIPTTDLWNEMLVEFNEAEKKTNEETLIQMHNAEVDAYELLKDLKDFPKPEIYYIERSTPKKAGLIMMNDLSQNGASLGIFYGVTENLCFNFAKHIADMQIYIDFMDGQPWRGRFTENLHAKDNLTETWMKVFAPVLDYDDKKLVEKAKIMMEMDAVKLGKYTTEDRAREIGHTTLCHGDAWVNNMMIQVNDDGSVSDQILAIIDWQTFFEGNPIFDIARFITNCTDAEIRRSCEYRVVDFYYDYLTKRYQEHGKTPKFTREEAHELYELAFVQEALLFGIMFGLMGIPLKDSTNTAEQAKCYKMALRFNLVMDDAIPLIEKYNLLERCKLTK